MKRLSTLYKIENAHEILKYASGLVVGLSGFSTRETSYLTLADFKTLSRLTKELNKELYISLKPFIQSQKDALIILFDLIKDDYITGLIVGDIGYYSLLKEYNIPIIYNPETLLTNYHDINLLSSYGIKGAFISKEIPLEDIKIIIKEKKMPLYLTGHGYLNMFYSRRYLLKTYFETIGIHHEYHHDQMRIKEERREGMHPIIEDDFGTHVFRDRVTSVYAHLDDLKGIDYILIDSIFHDDAYCIDVLKLFENPSDENAAHIKQKYNEEFDEGFLFKKTIYKG